MFLFPWLHHGESISNFEKSTFFHGDAIFQLLSRSSLVILGPQMKFKSIMGPVEYSEGSKNFIIEKYKIPAFKRRV